MTSGRSTQRCPRRGGPALLVAIVAVVTAAVMAVPAGPPRHAAAVGSDTVVYANVATFEVQPSGRVHVRYQFTVTNGQRPTTGGIGAPAGGGTLSSVTVGIPRDMLGDLVVRDERGQELMWDIDHGDTALDVPIEFDPVAVTLSAPLTQGATARFGAEFGLTDKVDTTHESSPVLNPAYVNFTAFAPATPAKLTLRVVVPSMFDVDRVVDSRGHTLEPLPADTPTDADTDTTMPGARRYEMVGVSSPDDYSIEVSAHNDRRYVRSSLTTPSGAEFVVLGWPAGDDSSGDNPWLTDIAATLDESTAALVATTGRPWPLTEPVVVRQVGNAVADRMRLGILDDTPQLDVADWFDTVDVLLQLAPAWVANHRFAEPWITYGASFEYALRAAGSLDRSWSTQILPESPGIVVAPLNDWQPTVQYASNDQDRELQSWTVSFWVFNELTRELGSMRMNEILDRALRDERAYWLPGDVRATGSNTFGWRQLLDMLEQVGGSQQARRLFERYVVTDRQRPELALRDTVRGQYLQLERAGGPWQVPAGIRMQMSSWRFRDARADIGTAFDLLSLRDQAAAASAALQVGTPERLRTAFESAGGRGLEPQRAEFQQWLDAVRRVTEARRLADQPRSWSQRVGLLGDDVDRDVKAAIDALRADQPGDAIRLADAVIGTLTGAGDSGEIRLWWAAGLAVLGVAAAG